MLTPPRHRFWTAPTLWSAGAGLAILAALIASGLFSKPVVNLNGWPQLWQFLRASVRPDLSPDFLRLTLQATVTTLAYAVCGTTLSLLLGLVGGLLTAEVWWQAVFPKGQFPVWLPRSLLVVPRAIHEVIWGLFFVNIVGLDPLVAILGIAIPYGAIVAKVFAELLDETPRQPLQAILNSGVKPFPALLYGLLPQAFLDLLSYSFYRFECSIRSATVLGMIGAGGLGYEILLSLQSLRYTQLWTLFYALFILNGLVDLTSALVRRQLGSPSRIDLNLRSPSPPSPAGRLRLHPPTSSPPHLPHLPYLLPLLLIPLSFWLVGADFSKLWSPRAIRLFGDLARTALPLRATPTDLLQLSSLAGQTLAMSILAITLASLGGLLLSFPAAHNFFLPGGLLRGHRESAGQRLLAWLGLIVSRSLLLICRAIPAPVWALVALFVLFPGILPGAIALGIHNLGILGRLMAEVTENLDQRPLLALKAQGSPAALVFLYGVLPLTLTRFLAYSLYRWEVCLRETVIVGLVGAGGLGRLLTEQLSSFDYRGVLLSLIVFLGLTLGVDGLSARARQSLREGG